MEFIDFIELAYWVKYPGLSACSGGRPGLHFLLSLGQNLP